jgi:hypothetical protein
VSGSRGDRPQLPLGKHDTDTQTPIPSYRLRTFINYISKKVPNKASRTTD